MGLQRVHNKTSSMETCLAPNHLLMEESYYIILTIVIRNGKIVWKHRPNRPFYGIMFRTKIYQNPTHLRKRVGGGAGGSSNYAYVCHKTELSELKILLIKRKNIHYTSEIKIFINSNLNFTMWVFAWGLANDHDVHKKYESYVLFNSSNCMILHVDACALLQ